MKKLFLTFFLLSSALGAMDKNNIPYHLSLQDDEETPLNLFPLSPGLEEPVFIPREKTSSPHLVQNFLNQSNNSPSLPSANLPHNRPDTDATISALLPPSPNDIDDFLEKFLEEEEEEEERSKRHCPLSQPSSREGREENNDYLQVPQPIIAAAAAASPLESPHAPPNAHNAAGLENDWQYSGPPGFLDDTNSLSPTLPPLWLFEDQEMLPKVTTNKNQQKPLAAAAAAATSPGLSRALSNNTQQIRNPEYNESEEEETNNLQASDNLIINNPPIVYEKTLIQKSIKPTLCTVSTEGAKKTSYQCRLCNFKNNDLSRFSTHYKIKHSGEKFFLCCLCECEIKGYPGMVRHLQNYHSDKSKKRTAEEKEEEEERETNSLQASDNLIVKNPLIAYEKTPIQKSINPTLCTITVYGQRNFIYTCSLCPSITNRSSLLTIADHFKHNHNENYLFRCCFCGKEFNDLNTTHGHLKRCQIK